MYCTSSALYSSGCRRSVLFHFLVLASWPGSLGLLLCSHTYLSHRPVTRWRLCWNPAPREIRAARGEVCVSGAREAGGSPAPGRGPAAGLSAARACARGPRAAGGHLGAVPLWGSSTGALTAPMGPRRQAGGLGGCRVRSRRVRSAPRPPALPRTWRRHLRTRPAPRSEPGPLPRVQWFCWVSPRCKAGVCVIQLLCYSLVNLSFGTGCTSAKNLGG